MIEQPRLTINLGALAHNLNCLQSKLNKNTEFIAVVKANAYGMGSIRIAQELSRLGVSRFAIAYSYEGIVLRKAAVKEAIMVFYPQVSELEKIIEYQLEPVLYSLEIIDAFVNVLKQKNIAEYPVHIKYNSGLNRIGLSFSELISTLKSANISKLKILSVYSHLGASENPRPCNFTQKQIDAFDKIQSEVKLLSNPLPKFHLLNSSGIFNYPEYHLDAVRSGIALYGFANRPEWDAQLKPIASLNAPICQIHFVKKGESVGYNQGWVAPKDCRIGVIALGHADGIGRQYGNGVGKVKINNQEAPIIGNVCMDMLMIDLGSINCKTGTVVTFFDQDTTAAAFANLGNTISYEILTALSLRIERVYV